MSIALFETVAYLHFYIERYASADPEGASARSSGYAGGDCSLVVQEFCAICSIVCFLMSEKKADRYNTVQTVK